MGIYGMGKAFNLRYANSGQFRSQHVRFRQPSRPMFGGNVTYTENTNVTIKNGPSGFWGFLGGLFGGLFGGGMFGSSMSMNMGMGMPMGGFSPFGMLNTQMTQPTTQKPQTDELGNLQKMYSKYTVLSNNDGTYTLTTGKGDNVKTGTYAELMKGLDSEPEGSAKTPENKDQKPPVEDSGSTPRKQEEPQGAGDKNPGSDLAKEFSNYQGTMSVHDDVRGSQYDINGNSSVSSEKNASGYPQTITVKGNRYEFQRMEDGKAIYKSLDGAGDEYKLEKNANGKFALNQYEGDKGAGTADISTLKSKSRTSSSTKTTSTNPNNNENTTKHTVDPNNIVILGNKASYQVNRKPPLAPKTIEIDINPKDAWSADGRANIAKQLQDLIDKGDL